MAESNADKMYKLGQELGAARTSLAMLKEKIAQGGEMAKTFALQAEAKGAELAAREKDLARLAQLKGGALGKVVGLAGELAAKVGGKRLAAMAAGPVGVALSTAQDAAASDDLGPKKGSAAYKLERNEELSVADRAELFPKKYNIGGLVDESPEYGLADGGSPEQELGKSVAREMGKSDSVGISVEEEMDKLRSERPEYKEMSDKVLSQAILDRRANKKADGGFVYNVDAEQLGMGIRTEFEHTDDANIALKIAMDHLAEDPKYYAKLQKVEGKKLAMGGKVRAAEGYAPEKGRRALEDQIDKLENEDLQEAMYKRSLELKQGPKDEKIDADVDWSSYKKGEGKKELQKSGKLKKGGVVEGDEDEYAGDPIPAQLNKNELVLNVEQQQKLIDKLNNRESKLPTHDRIDNLLNRKELAVDIDEQSKLFKYIKGESDKKPTGHIVIKNFADGGSDELPAVDQAAMQEPQSVPMVPNAPVPVAPMNVKPPMGLPESMKYTGPDAGPGGTLPVAAPEADLTGIDKTNDAMLKAAQTEQLAKAQAGAAIQIAQAASAKQLAIKSMQGVKARETVANAENITMSQIAQKLMADDDLKQHDEHQSTMGKYFATASMPEKILMGAALAISLPVSIITGKNPALDYMEGSINQDLNAQKLDLDTKLSKKKYYLDLYKTAIDKQMADSNSTQAKTHGKLMIAQIDQIQQGLDVQRMQLKMAQAQQQMLQQATSGANKEGVSIEAINMLPKDMQEKAVRMPNDKVKFAFDKERAQKVTEYANEVVPAINGAKRILDIAQDLNRVTDLEKRARIASEMKALGGQLRLPFTGPGILTDKEFDRLMDTIGDPNKLVALPSLQKAKLETVISKLQKDLAAHYKNAGVPVETSSNEKNVQTLLKNNKGMSEYDAERALKRAGYWVKE